MGTDGRSSRFTLQAWSIRDGAGPIALPVRDVQSQPCAGYLVGRVADRVAIAFGGRAFSTQVQVNAIAWLAGQPPSLIGIETVTVAEVFRAAGLEPPAIFPPDEAAVAEADFPWGPVAAMVGALVVCAAVLRRLIA